MVTFEHVYGHTGAHENEMADAAANAGTKRKVSGQSKRWKETPDEDPDMDDGVVWKECRKCGVPVRQKDLKWHVRRCEGTLQEGSEVRARPKAEAKAKAAPKAKAKATAKRSALATRAAQPKAKAKTKAKAKAKGKAKAAGGPRTAAARRPANRRPAVG